MQQKIVQDGQKFRIKRVDDNGNSLGLLPNVFNSEEEAKSFMDTPEKEEETTPETTPEETPEAPADGEGEKTAE